MRGIAIAATAMLALSGCAESGKVTADRDARAERELAAFTKGRVAGEPVSCIDAARSGGGPRIVPPDKLVYNDTGTVWISQVQDCPFLSDSEAIVISELYGSRVCDSDRFRTVPRGLSIPSGYCRYGQFTPWRKPKG